MPVSGQRHSVLMHPFCPMRQVSKRRRRAPSGRPDTGSLRGQAAAEVRARPGTSTRRMSGNIFGTLFCVTSFGESHGPAIGCVVDGCPPGLELARPTSSRARPAQARHLAPRHAAARARHGRDPLRCVRRPDDGHADRAADPQPGPAQQGLRQHRRHLPPRSRRLHLLAEVRHPRYRGGGRSSARETAVRVAAGAIARKWLRERTAS
jgi:chorismate synthase